MAHGGVAAGGGGELAFLKLGIRRHAGVPVAFRQLEHGQVQGVKAGQGDELEAVTHGPQLVLEAGDGVVVQVGLPVEGGGAIVGQHLAGETGVDALGETPGLVQVRL